MPLQRLEHVNVRTHQLETMIQWYDEVLGIKSGWRPPFSSVGAWLYLGEQPIVHLVQSEQEHRGEDPKLEHFALSGTGLKDFLALLEQREIQFHLVRVPVLGDLQVNVFDPDGNAIHIDFPDKEATALGL